MLAYHRPRSMLEALQLRASGDMIVLAGGTDVYPAKAQRTAWGDMRQPAVLDIAALSDLGHIVEAHDHWRLGALVTWSDLVRADVPPLFDGLKAAARAIGGRQIQNRGTLVGNICTASPAGDGAPNLIALDARVELASLAGRRVVDMAAFIDGYRHTVCRSDEIVTAILVPKRPGARAHFLKLGARAYLVISVVMVAGVVETDAAGKVTHIRLLVGSCSAVPQRLSALEAALAGAPLVGAADRVGEEHVAALAPIDDIRGSAVYRRSAAVALIRDLLAELLPARPRRVA